MSSAPCSPCLMTTRLGPRARIQRPARWMFQSPLSSRASPSFTISTSTRPSSSEQRGLLALDPVVHGVAHHQLGPLDLIQHAELELGIDVAEEDELGGPERRPGAWAGSRRRRRAGSPASPGSADRRSICPSSGSSRPRPAPRPTSRCPAAPARSSSCERIVAAHHADHLHRMQHRAGHAEVHRRAAQRVGGLAERREDRVQRDAADDEQAHQVTSGRGRRCRAG